MESQLQDQIRELDRKVDKILFVIGGDEDMGQQGLARRVDAIDKWIQEKKIHDAKMIAISSGISSLAIYILNLYMTIKGEK